MKFKEVNIKTLASTNASASILIVYTGGTLGMVYDEKGTLVPFDFGKIRENIPLLKKFNLKLTVISFSDPIDSSNISLDNWIDIGTIILENYQRYDGFVVLHGTDTMAYTASALSYMLNGLAKPVIFTGAQLPLGAMRSDARENLYTALEIASARKNGRPLVQEVCIFFNSLLLRGNRSKKVRSSHFGAFKSENYPILAQAGVIIDFNEPALLKPRLDHGKLKLHTHFDDSITIIKLFPNLNETMLERMLTIPGLRGAVMETYGSGNAPTDPWFLNCLSKAIKKGMIIFNVSQCVGGKVIQGRYATSKQLEDIGVVSGNDITTEAAVTKLMFVLGDENSIKKVKKKLILPISGEMN